MALLPMLLTQFLRARGVSLPVCAAHATPPLPQSVPFRLCCSRKFSAPAECIFPPEPRIRVLLICGFLPLTFLLRFRKRICLPAGTASSLPLLPSSYLDTCTVSFTFFFPQVTVITVFPDFLARIFPLRETAATFLLEDRYMIRSVAVTGATAG